MNHTLQLSNLRTHVITSNNLRNGLNYMELSTYSSTKNFIINKKRELRMLLKWIILTETQTNDKQQQKLASVPKPDRNL